MTIQLCKWSDEPEKWALFDTIVDRFVVWDANLAEIGQWYLDAERQRAIDACQRFIDRGPTITKQDGLETQRRVHGQAWVDRHESEGAA